MTPYFFNKFNLLKSNLPTERNGYKGYYSANQMNQNFTKLNMGETNSVISWRECTANVPKEQQLPDDSISHARTAHTCATWACYLQYLPISLRKL